MEQPICSVLSCGRRHHARGLCKAHWKRWRKHGDVNPDVPISDAVSLPAADRFWLQVHKTENCWLWTGKIDHQGYGTFYSESRSHIAHVWVYRNSVGCIPDGLVIDHVKARGCEHRHCVNPSHLEPVTQRENVLRGRRTKLSDADALRAWKLYLEGGTQVAIARTLGVSPPALSYRFKKLGLR